MRRGECGTLRPCRCVFFALPVCAPGQPGPRHSLFQCFCSTCARVTLGDLPASAVNVLMNHRRLVRLVVFSSDGLASVRVSRPPTMPVCVLSREACSLAPATRARGLVQPLFFSRNTRTHTRFDAWYWHEAKVGTLLGQGAWGCVRHVHPVVCCVSGALCFAALLRTPRLLHYGLRAPYRPCLLP
jgi:hypothetical protein